MSFADRVREGQRAQEAGRLWTAHHLGEAALGPSPEDRRLMQRAKDVLDVLLVQDAIGQTPAAGNRQRLRRQEMGRADFVDSWVLCGRVDGYDPNGSAGNPEDVVYRSYNLGSDGQIYRVEAQIHAGRGDAGLPREIMAWGRETTAIGDMNTFVRVDERGIAGIPAIESGLVELAVAAGMDPAIFE